MRSAPRPSPTALAGLDTDLTSVAVAQPRHDCPMKQVRERTSSRWNGTPGALANMKAADAHARASASTLRELIAAGFISRRALADELNRRGMPTDRGGRWHYTTVVRMLTRLGMLTSGTGGRINNGQASKRAADARAKKLARTIRALQAKGHISFSAIAHALNKRDIPNASGGRWHPASVSRLVERLESLDRASNGKHRR
jgi:hypothetical protein